MKTDQEFLNALIESQSHVAAVASWMARQNFNVMISPAICRPDFKDRFEFIDQGDIIVSSRIEVKKRSIDFTCRDDYPFPTVIVDEKFKVDRIPPPQLNGYVILNNRGTHACLISVKTRKHWRPIIRRDSKDKQRRTFYECPKGRCAFHAITL